MAEPPANIEVKGVSAKEHFEQFDTWDADWPTWKVGDETVGVMTNPGHGIVTDAVFFGPVSEFKGARLRMSLFGILAEHKSDKEYIFKVREVQKDGKRHFGGYFNDATQNLYRLMIDSVNSSSDVTVNSLIKKKDMKLEEDEGYMWLTMGQSVGPLNFDLGYVLPVLLTAVFQKENGTPISDFGITPLNIPITSLQNEEQFEEDIIKKMLRYDTKQINLIIQKNPDEKRTKTMFTGILNYRRLKELGIDHPLTSIRQLDKLSKIDPSNPDHIATLKRDLSEHSEDALSEHSEDAQPTISAPSASGAK
jgi:hypothetical protein